MKTPAKPQAPAPEPPMYGAFFGTVKTAAGYVPVKMDFPKQEVKYLADPMPYLAIAVQVAEQAMRDHYLESTR